MSDVTAERLADAFTQPLQTRHVAAERLQKVAEAVSCGSYPDDVTPEELGEAVSRALVNWGGGSLSAAFARMCVGFWRGRQP